MTDLIEVYVPDIGGAKDVEVVELLVKAGDEVDVEQGLLSVETDKATMEVPSPHKGIIAELKVAEGSKVNEGDLIALIRAVGSEASGLPSDTTAPESEPRGSTTTETDPAVGKEPGGNKEPAGRADEPTPERTQPQPPGSQQQTSSSASHGTNAPAMPTSAKPSPSSGQLVYASPSIRKLSRELEIPLDAVQGTGEKGRITKEDLYRYVNSALKEKAPSSASPAAASSGIFSDLPAWPSVNFERYGPVQRVALSRVKKISGPNLHRNWVSIPHVTSHEDADISDLEAFRLELNQEYQAEGTKITLLALIIKAAVAALRAFPEFNSSLDGGELVLKNYYHIGFAADTPNGLLVPVIRDADKKGIIAIAKEVSQLAKKAREGKLSTDEMSGGTFSISSLGGIGGTYFTPIINAPEVAILGIAKARTQVVWNGEAPEPRLILPMSLSWDHRVVDGAMAGRFNAYLAFILGDFRRALL